MVNPHVGLTLDVNEEISLENTFLEFKEDSGGGSELISIHEQSRALRVSFQRSFLRPSRPGNANFRKTMQTHQCFSARKRGVLCRKNPFFGGYTQKGRKTK
jgi:hypothetical protein